MITVPDSFNKEPTLDDNKYNKRYCNIDNIYNSDLYNYFNPIRCSHYQWDCN